MEQLGIAVVFPVPTVPRKGRGLVLCFRYQKKILSCTEQKSPPNRRAFLFRMTGVFCEAGKDLFALPGNRRRHTRIAASFRKKRVGEGWGARGEGKPLRASQGVSFPPHFLLQTAFAHEAEAEIRLVEGVEVDAGGAGVHEAADLIDGEAQADFPHGFGAAPGVGLFQ